MMVLHRDSGRILHAVVRDLPGFLDPETVVVVNDTRVRKARLFGRAEPGGREAEFLLLEELESGWWQVLAQRASKMRPGKVFLFPREVRGTVSEPVDGLPSLRFRPLIDEAYLEDCGHVPLPPYIRRADTPEDGLRYQTIYARALGSVAAPTAGLHLTEGILQGLRERGIQLLPLTLHVGLGTFLPIRTERVEDHPMHRESYAISSETASRLNEALACGKRILAVGTTVVRALESASADQASACADQASASADQVSASADQASASADQASASADQASAVGTAVRICPGPGSTDLFIYPGYRFRAVSRLLTNFHTPKSSLLLLVAAFAGRQCILAAYRQAVRSGYRFFSYGDAMLIL